MRIDCGPGHRGISFGAATQVVVLLCGGDKQNQGQDIARALELAQEI